MINNQYQPKGGMCMSCTSINRDCSHLPFNTMQVIDSYNDIKIVKCSEYIRFTKVMSLFLSKTKTQQEA